MSANESSIHSGHRARMRRRYYETGLAGFQPHEVLELILYCSIPKKDVNPLAHQLIEHFGSLHGVLSASEEELLSIPGVGKSTCRLLQSLNAVCRDYQETRCTGSRTIVDIGVALRYARMYSHRSYVKEIILMLENHAGMLLSVRIFSGQPDDPTVLREILAAALSVPTHSAIIFLKEMGPLRKPNKAALQSFSILVSALADVNIYTIDLILLSGNHVYSLRRASILTDETSCFRESLPNPFYWLYPLDAYSAENNWCHVPPDAFPEKPKNSLL